MFFRLAPIAMRKATSPRRCWVRNQKVPITPRKIFNNRKKRIQNWVRNSLSLSISLAAHFFVFYFGIVADITPPVALAAYAGSAIAKANPMKTAFTASKLAIAVFIVPYVFCFNPAMLLIDTTPLKVVQIFITSLIGVFGLSSSLEGFLSVKMSVPVRVLMAAGGLMLIDPSLMTDVVGILLIVGCCVWQTAQKKKTA